jgi:nucleoside-diphosphate-sugar epimerase
LRALVTGAGGFVGSALVDRLRSEGRYETLVLVDVAPPGAQGDDLLSVVGDFGDPAVRDRALQQPVDVVFHLAGVMGGAAEADYDLSRRINLDATLDLVEAASSRGRRPRVVYTSTVAVFGAPLPPAVDDATPLSPAMTYGAHKLMMEIALADLHRRGSIEAVTVRLPGILARPAGGQGMKSAFMSEVFHALVEGRSYVVPVSPDATLWAMSLDRCVSNLVHAATVNPARLPPGRAVTLPAVRPRFGDMVQVAAGALGVDPEKVRYVPDPVLEAQFGALPPLEAQAAIDAGFADDGDVVGLVSAVLGRLGRPA